MSIIPNRLTLPWNKKQKTKSRWWKKHWTERISKFKGGVWYVRVCRFLIYNRTLHMVIRWWGKKCFTSRVVSCSLYRGIISILDSHGCQQCFGSFERDMPRSTPSIMIASIIEGTSTPRIERERDMTFENVLPERESWLYPDINQQHNCWIVLFPVQKWNCSYTQL